jgi:hypothetical protein
VTPAVRHAFKLFGCALAALWALDVQVNLGLVPGAFLPDRLDARARDFLSLALISSQVALAVALAALAGGFLLALAARGRAFDRIAS